MKRPQKTTLPPAQVLPRTVLDLAKERLADDYLGFVSGTAAEEPKLYVQRIEAAGAAYEQLERIGGAGEEPAEATDDVLRDLRLHMSSEAPEEDTA
jgi:hypothetical protein